MRYPDPVPGLLIRYSYLWRTEHDRGAQEGFKDRPCAIVLLSVAQGTRKTVTVLPITHAAPIDPALAIALPLLTKRRLGLDDADAWIILSEANRFVWPGPDLRPVAATGMFAYGLLPEVLFKTVQNRFADAVERQLLDVTLRTE